jgi:ABC-2 type transport system ATP-binding protein
MTDSSVIKVEQLTKYYGINRGIEDVNFSVDKGEIFGFLGPNGAGKTTTIRLLLDLLRPTTGNIFILNKSIKENSFEIRRRCGYLPSDFNPYGSMTGADLLKFFIKIRTVEPRLQKDLIARFSFGDHLSKEIKHLSHGNRQKLGLIQTFFHAPELVVMDEPTIGLDPLMKDAFYEFLYEYANAGNTIFFSSHNLPEVEKVCQRVAIVRDGRLVALETLKNLKKKRFRRLIIRLNRPMKNLTIPGARLDGQKGLEYNFLIKGDIKILLKNLSDLPVEDIVFPEPDLEEVFMYFYRGKDDD